MDSALNVMNPASIGKSFHGADSAPHLARLKLQPVANRGIAFVWRLN